MSQSVAAAWFRHAPCEDLAAIFAKVCRDGDAELKECNGEDDHVHLLVIYPPQVAVATLVDNLTGVSTVRWHRPEISGRYKDGVVCSPCYFAGSCASAIDYCRARPQPKRGCASSPSARTEYPARELR